MQKKLTPCLTKSCKTDILMARTDQMNKNSVGKSLETWDRKLSQ